MTYLAIGHNWRVGAAKADELVQRVRAVIGVRLNPDVHQVRWVDAEYPEYNERGEAYVQRAKGAMMNDAEATRPDQPGALISGRQLRAAELRALRAAVEKSGD